MAKTVNNVKINTTFATATAREQLTSGENLCTSLGKINKYLADLDTGAFTFPANGGNADTLDGFHETSFPRNREDILDCNKAILPGTYNATPETVNTPYAAYWLISVETGSNGAWIRQTATRCDTSIPNDTYHRLYVNGEWSSNSWTKINDGGNAATVSGKSDTDFFNYVGVVDDLFAVNKTCVCAWNSGTLNTPYKAGLTGAGGGLCIINSANGSTYTSYIVMVSDGTSIYSASSNAGAIRGNWIKVGDGGNAASVGAYTEAKLAALEARVAALEGK